MVVTKVELYKADGLDHKCDICFASVELDEELFISEIKLCKDDEGKHYLYFPHINKYNIVKHNVYKSKVVGVKGGYMYCKIIKAILKELILGRLVYWQAINR
jgi:DNA-binding cell septation regulator SpoVG